MRQRGAAAAAAACAAVPHVPSFNSRDTPVAASDCDLTQDAQYVRFFFPFRGNVRVGNLNIVMETLPHFVCFFLRAIVEALELMQREVGCICSSTCCETCDCLRARHTAAAHGDDVTVLSRQRQRTVEPSGQQSSRNDSGWPQVILDLRLQLCRRHALLEAVQPAADGST